MIKKALLAWWSAWDTQTLNWWPVSQLRGDNHYTDIAYLLSQKVFNCDWLTKDTVLFQTSRTRGYNAFQITTFLTEYMPSLLTPFLDGEEKKIMISDGTETITCEKKNNALTFLKKSKKKSVFISHVYAKTDFSRSQNKQAQAFQAITRSDLFSARWKCSCFSSCRAPLGAFELSIGGTNSHPT